MLMHAIPSLIFNGLGYHNVICCKPDLTKHVDESSCWFCRKHINSYFLMNAVYLEMIYLVMDYFQKYAEYSNVPGGTCIKKCLNILPIIMIIISHKKKERKVINGSVHFKN